ncbi:hypothetical protein ACD574_02770 [Campylobacter sp. LH-2024]
MGQIQLRHDPTFNPINIDIAPEIKDYQEIWGNILIIILQTLDF